MKDKKISAAWSRHQARKMVKECVDLKSTQLVHHVDHNPFNNDIENFDIMLRGDHTRHHLKGTHHHHSLKAAPHNLKRLLRNLERNLLLFNNFNI